MRRTILSSVLVLLSATFALSQNYAVDKGSSIISFAGSFTSSGGDLFENIHGDRTTTIMLPVTYHYFVIPNLFIGGGIAYTRQSQGNDSYSTIGIGPTLGYAIGKAESSCYPYFATGIRYYNIGISSTSVSGTDIVFGGGIIAPVKEHVGITVEVGYHILSLKPENFTESVSGNIISVGVGVAGLLF